ncbi:MAG: nuclear transport factor 2 family protein [Candidatus Palauibacterales bacterium]|nr:nuclear transport factor 2 family protein [Candidatus Palauibacterales bacterium]
MTAVRRSVAAAAAVLLAAPGAGCWVEEVPPSEQREWRGAEAPDSVIRSALDSSAAGWNRGEIGDFLASYRQSDSTTYIGSGGLRSGFAELRERYEPVFSGEARRDSLRFGDVRVRGLGEGRALSIGRYTLLRGDSVTGTGWFSLVWERIQGRWWIVHDHSSAVPLPSASPDGS